jgi:hypothetical protein
MHCHRGFTERTIALKISINEQLYWTDHGEHSLGCSLDRADLSGLSEAGGINSRKEILALHFNEPIGLKLGSKWTNCLPGQGGKEDSALERQ